eukprot:7599-Heterococcus_DN1.PRE.2
MLVSAWCVLCSYMTDCEKTVIQKSLIAVFACEVYMSVQLHMLVTSVFKPDLSYILNSFIRPALLLRYRILSVYAVSATITVLLHARALTCYSVAIATVILMQIYSLSRCGDQAQYYLTTVIGVQLERTALFVHIVFAVKYVPHTDDYHYIP